MPGAPALTTGARPAPPPDPPLLPKPLSVVAPPPPPLAVNNMAFEVLPAEIIELVPF